MKRPGFPNGSEPHLTGPAFDGNAVPVTEETDAGLAGAILHERYRMEDVLGHGGMGAARREEARKDAEEQRKKAQKEAEKQRGGG